MKRKQAALAVVVLTLSCVLAAAAPAGAYSLSVASSPAHPTDRTPFQLQASGSADDNGNAVVQITIKPAGAGGCGSSESADSGTASTPDGTRVGPGDFAVAGSPQTLAPGGYLVCGWLVDGNGDATQPEAATSLNLDVGAEDTLALSWSDSDPVQGRPLDLKAGGTSYDSNATVFATSRATGGACAGTPSADAGTQLIPGGQDVGNGPFAATLVSNRSFDAGVQLLCGWLTDSQRGSVIAATSATLNVRPAQVSVAIGAPPRGDVGDSPAITVRVHSDWGVPLAVDADLKSGASARCADTASHEPTGATSLADGVQVLDTQQPAGDVTAPVEPPPLAKPGSYLLCAWVKAGWAGAPADETLAGPASARMTAVTPRTYSGHTRQHLPISIVLAQVSRQILEVDVSDRYRCRGGPIFFTTGGRWNGVFDNTLNQSVLGDVRLDKTGRFHDDLNGNPRSRLSIRGILQGTSIKGSLQASGRSNAIVSTKRNTSCRTGLVHFTAKAR